MILQRRSRGRKVQGPLNPLLSREDILSMVPLYSTMSLCWEVQKIFPEPEFHADPVYCVFAPLLQGASFCAGSAKWDFLLHFYSIFISNALLCNQCWGVPFCLLLHYPMSLDFSSLWLPLNFSILSQMPTLIGNCLQL